MITDFILMNKDSLTQGSQSGHIIFDLFLQGENSWSIYKTNKSTGGIGEIGKLYENQG